jgi:endo-1,4-beta-xylanase
MRVWSPLALTALATAVAACGGGNASDQGGGTESGSSAESSAPSQDAAPGSDSSRSGLDGAPVGTDSSIPGSDATTGTDGDGDDATRGAESGGGGDASPDATAADATAHDSGGGADSGQEASGADAAAHDAGMEASVNCTGAAQTGGTQYCSNSTGNVGNTGYSYQLWSNGTGSGCMTVFAVDAMFKADWSSAGDFLARVGLRFDETKTPAQMGTISADFAETKTGSASYSFIGIYGWSVNQLHEYYIVEDWFGSHPTASSLGSGATKVGTIVVDGGTYDVYTHTQTNQPALAGTATFVQFFSIRQTSHTCGHISISEHFSQWASLGMQLGDLEEARILVEAGGNASGNIDFTTASVTAN